MPSKARRKSQRAASMVVKTDADIVAETERVAAAAGVSRDKFVTHALRHYLRFHALTGRNRVRWVRGRRVTPLFPDQPPAVAQAAAAGTRRRRGSRTAQD